MKRILILLCAAVAMTLAGANASAQISIGAGPATRLYFPKGEDAPYTYGVQLSFEDSQRVSDWFGYSAGIDFGTYGNKAFFQPGAGAADAAAIGLSEMYVDIPVRAKFYVPFSDAFQLFLFGGVSPSVCISSNIREASGKVSRFRKDSDYSRYDLLAGGGIGAEVAECIKFALGYDHGVLDRDRSGTAKQHVAAVKFTVSYLF